MLTNLFSKSRPINYFLITIALLLVYLVNLFTDFSWSTSSFSLVNKIILFLVLGLSVFVVQFITFKNQLANQNLYSLFFYTCFFILFSTILDNNEVIVANFFVLLALRRIFSLHSLRDVKQKIFDAAFLILVASLFHFWSILFIILLYFAILWFVSEDYRNWFIPFISLFSVSILFYTYTLYADISFINYWKDHAVVSFNFTYFENIYQNIALALFTSIACLFAFSQVLEIRKLPISLHAIYNLLLVSFLVGVSIYVLSDHKMNSLLVYTFFPLSILGANYMERLAKNWMKELTLVSVLGISIWIFITQL
ncbi:hypothetical protein EG240_09035 [Paenimyroides tangerinum]|uniref:EpsG family protein n=1 Tax=Paenimyroides tangerinum TaxID=2488728 RepID=A0A3P3W5H6_9FLAO|nr:DUF6427 family protein [Paenimyroides tangerinum]RRJ90385.1 hypothetical protein EG240_09035 [Paenimyroides tangerinum]